MKKPFATQPVGFHPLAYLEGNSHAENFSFLKEIPREEKQEAVYGIEHKFSIGTIVVLGESDKYYKVLFKLMWKFDFKSKSGRNALQLPFPTTIYNKIKL